MPEFVAGARDVRGRPDRPLTDPPGALGAGSVSEPAGGRISG